MIIQPRTNVIYVDVDGTLLIWPGPKPGQSQAHRGVIPPVNEKLITALYAWKLRRASGGLKNETMLVVWSRGSMSHIKWAVTLCDIWDIVDLVTRKPDMVVDDGFNWWDRRTEKVPPP